MIWFIRLSVLAAFSISVVGCTEAPAVEDEDTARIRVVNASTDTSLVDGCIDDAGSVFESVGGQARGTTYAEVVAGDHMVNFVAEDAACTDTPIVGASFSLAADTDSTLLIFGAPGEIESKLLADDNSAPAAGMARLRFVHTHVDGPQVNVHLVDGTQLVDDLQFRDASEYVAINAGEFMLQIRSADGEEILRTFVSITANEGEVITFFFLNLDDLDVSPAVFLTREVE